MRVRIAMVLALLGCEPPSAAPRAQGPARNTKLNQPPRPMPARSPWSVTIYKVRAPAAPFVEVYQIADLGENENAALATLRLSSAQLGCDGLIVGSAQVESVVAGSVQKVSLPGTCIMFASDPGTWREPEPEAASAPELQAQPQPKPEPLPQDSEECVQARAKIFATKNPRMRAWMISAMPSKCHPR